MKPFMNFLAAGVVAAAFAGAAQAQEPAETLTVDDAVKVVLAGAPDTKVLTITSSSAQPEDQTLSADAVQLQSLATCSGGKGVQRTYLAMASAADLQKKHATMEDIAPLAVQGFKDVDNDMFFTPAPDDQRPAGMSASEWQSRYYLGRLANAFEAAQGVTLTFLRVEVPNPNMHCNVPPANVVVVPK
jgi:hypothetical protein